MATILIVEDDLRLQAAYEQAFVGHTVHLAATARAARQLFREHCEQIDFIILDGYLAKNSAESTTLQLAQELRVRRFSGPILAASSDMNMCDWLVKAGCTHTVMGRKERAVAIAFEIIQELPVKPQT